MNPMTAGHALLIIDMINPFQFKHGDLLLKHTKEMLWPLLELKKRASAHNVPIIYINDHYNLWQADYGRIIKHCKNEANEQLLSQIIPSADDYFLIKPKHSAFYGTALQTLLHQLGVKKLIITGIAGNICVLFTANDAYMREFRLYCPADCIASASREDNRYALTMMKNVLKADTSPQAGISFL